MSKAIEKFEDIEIYLPHVSAGGNNAYYIDTCPVVGHRPSYASCLAKVEQRKAGRLPTAQSDCSASIGRCECPAQGMRQKELDAGQAMFFINRRKLNEFVAEREGRAMGFHEARPPASPPATRPAPAPKKPVFAPDEGYGAAINAALKKLPQAPVPVPVAAQPNPAPTVAQAKAGMSLLELARLQLASQSQAKPT